MTTPTPGWELAAEIEWARSLCGERWGDEEGCAEPALSAEHECGRTGRHRTHHCRWCDAMVIEDPSLYSVLTRSWEPVEDGAR